MRMVAGQPDDYTVHKNFSKGEPVATIKRVKKQVQWQGGALLDFETKKGSIGITNSSSRYNADLKIKWGL